MKATPRSSLGRGGPAVVRAKHSHMRTLISCLVFNQILKPQVCNRSASRLRIVYMRPASLHQGCLRSPLGAGACSCATASPLRGCQSRCLKTSATPQGTQHCAQQLQACAYTFGQGRMPKGQVVARQRLFVSRSFGQEGWDCQVSSAPEPQSRVPHPFPVKALTLST